MSDTHLTWHTTTSTKVPEWKINNMEYGLQGVVHTVDWTCRITRWGTEDNDFVATNGTTTLQPIDPNVEHFVQFQDLTEQMVLEWVRQEMMEKWVETENDIVNAWNNSIWVKKAKKIDGLPWDGGVLRSTEEEEEPSWAKTAVESTDFEPLDMPEDESVHSERNAGIEDESEVSIESPPKSVGYTPMFGNNLDEEE